MDYFGDTSLDDEPIFINYEDIKMILLKDIPKGVNFEVVGILGDNHYETKLEGVFTVNSNWVNVHMYHNWYRKYWDNPLGLKYHMDLMKRLLEFRGEHFKDTYNVEFDDEGDWCHLYYDFKINYDNNENLEKVFSRALQKYKWVEDHVNKVQERIFNLINEIREEYNVYKLVDIPKLYHMTEIEKNSQVKGAILEELVSRIFSSIDGFSVKERVRTDTEEIDVVIRNQSTDTIWIKESPVILIECKNWTSVVGKNEYVVFREKVKNRNSRAKVGILVSWNGFASTVNKENLRNSKDDIVIISLDKNDIKDIMESDSYIEKIKEFYFDAIC